MNHHTPIIEHARRMAADAPAGDTATHSHGTTRRGLGGENDMGHHLARVNSPAAKYESCYLARRATAIHVVFWACMAIGALSIGAQLTGHTEALRAIWHQTP